MRFYGHLLVPSSACPCTSKTVCMLQRRGFAISMSVSWALCAICFIVIPRKSSQGSGLHRAGCCASRGRLKSQTLLKPMEKVSPSSGFYAGSCLGQAGNEIFLSPGAQMFVILHGLAAVRASKFLQNRSLFWAFIKKGIKKKKRENKSSMPKFLMQEY